MRGEKGFSSLVIIFGIVILFILVGVFSINLVKNPIINQNIAVQPEASHSLPTLDEVFYKKTQIDLGEKILSQFEFPKSLTSIKENDLVRMDCKNFNNFGDTYNAGSFSYHDDSSSTNISLSESAEFSKVLDLLKADLNKNINNIVLCRTEDNRLFVEYGNVISKYRGGGNPSDSYFAEIKEDKVIHISKIPAADFAYYSCSTPILLTQKDELYILCGGGEGGCSPRAEDIYKIDIFKKTYSKVTSCENKPNNKCEYTAICK